jgi:hypothetical protein
MIPYDELVATLAQWRIERGLATNAPARSARPATPPPPAAPILPTSRQSGSMPAYAVPAAPVLAEPDVAEINSFAPEFDAGDYVETEGTELRDPSAVAEGDIEVDDALDVLDEQDVDSRS